VHKLVVFAWVKHCWCYRNHRCTQDLCIYDRNSACSIKLLIWSIQIYLCFFLTSFPCVRFTSLMSSSDCPSPRCFRLTSMLNTNRRNVRSETPTIETWKKLLQDLKNLNEKVFFNEIQSDLVKTTPTIETWKTIVARLEETELEMVFFNEIQVKVVCQKRESL
jgi:hypothetical protein